MAYNNGFPIGYPQMYYAPQPQMQMQNVQPQPQPQPQNNGIIWVQGEAGAKSYLVAPNTTVQLWDSETQTIYLKSADASGMPSIKTLDYKVREATPHINIAPETEYALRSDLNALRDELEELRQVYGARAKTVRAKREDAENG